MEDDNPFVTHARKRDNAGLVPELIPGYTEDEQQIYESSDESNSSAESQVEVNEGVREDMCKLEEVFLSMGLKFRMIDRIGEGTRLSFPIFR